MKKNAFTLVELLVVIAIIAAIVALAVPNFLSARQRARDVKKKSELTQLKTALRLYYNDYNRYPSSGAGVNSLPGCGSNGTSTCPSSGCSANFAAGGSGGCDNIYMKTLPTSANFHYYMCADRDDFRLTAMLENLSDPDIKASQDRCKPDCSILIYASADYVVCAD